MFSWQAVTIGDFDIYTRRREHRGPSRTLRELLAEGESDGPLGNLWREDAMALIGIHEVAAAFIQERVDEAAAEAAYAASERLTTRFLRPAAAPAHPDVDECFEAFQAACQLRAPFCDSIQMEWGHDLDGSQAWLSVWHPGTRNRSCIRRTPTVRSSFTSTGSRPLSTLWRKTSWSSFQATPGRAWGRAMLPATCWPSRTPGTG